MTRSGEVPASSAPSRRSADAGRAPGQDAADQLAHSRKQHPSRRFTPDQKRLKQSVDAQRQVGRLLEPVMRSGATVLHGARVPGVSLTVDHIIVASGGVFVLIDVASDRRSTVDVSSAGVITRGGVLLDRLTQLVGDAARELAAQAGIVLPIGWTVITVPTLVVVGRSPLPDVRIAGEVTIVPARMLQRWIEDAFPPTLERESVDRLATAIHLICGGLDI